MTADADEKELFTIMKEMEYSRKEICEMLHILIDGYFRETKFHKKQFFPIFIFNENYFATGIIEEHQRETAIQRNELIVDAFKLVKHFSH